MGVPAVADWAKHFLLLAVYRFLHWDVQKYRPLIERLPPKSRFMMRRAMERWEFGSGQDYQ